MDFSKGREGGGGGEGGGKVSWFCYFLAYSRKLEWTLITEI